MEDTIGSCIKSTQDISGSTIVAMHMNHIDESRSSRIRRVYCLLHTVLGQCLQFRLHSYQVLLPSCATSTLGSPFNFKEPRAAQQKVATVSDEPGFDASPRTTNPS